MPGKSLVNILDILVARAWPWMACDYSEMCLLLAKSMVSAILFTAFVQAIQKSFVMLRNILLACCKPVIAPPYKSSATLAEGWILRGLMLFLLTPLPWVLHCKTVMAMGPHSLQPSFCISPAVLLKSFVAAQRVGFQQTICLKFPLGKQEHTKQCAFFPMPRAGEISLTIPNLKCRRKW